MHQVSRASNSITVSWPQPDQTNGNILDYQLRYYDQVGSRGRPWWGWWEVPGPHSGARGGGTGGVPQGPAAGEGGMWEAGRGDQDPTAGRE